MIKIIQIVIVAEKKTCKASISVDLKIIKLICLPKPDNARDQVIGVLLGSKSDSCPFKLQGRVPHPSAKVKQENETGRGWHRTSCVLLYF